ncbi:MAG TPA: hypothetical protein VNX46_18175, partial [Candidatus Acidoferrum sp.]|nr:hypothetical protein [Candidatus Acidoferrum sp.]
PNWQACRDNAAQSASGILPADLTLPESGAMPESFFIFRIAGRILLSLIFRQDGPMPDWQGSTL